MTDLEMTRLCAEAIGFVPYYDQDNPANRCLIQFDPLHDDAQAMALVKKFRVWQLAREDYWQTDLYINGRWSGKGESPDLNRAIVECCARMQRAKT